MPEQITFIGLGRMGALMASRLLEAGFPLRVYNRSPEKARAGRARSKTGCKSIRGGHTRRYISDHGRG